MSGDLECLGLGVAICTIDAADPALLTVAFYGDVAAREAAPQVRQATFRSEDGPIALPGRCILRSADGDALDLDVAATGDFGFALTVRRADAVISRALGLRDREVDGRLVASWWTGTIEPYGVVQYTIRDARTIDGYYISKMSPDLPGRDVATGDTVGGFPGAYVLHSREVNGRTWGPHDWLLTQRGAIIDLAWREHGRIFCRGLGIIDPQNPEAIIATYIAL
jgi:hypothetical protein